jgi:hypothetical protein
MKSILFILICFICLFSCSYQVTRTANGEALINSKFYKLNQSMTLNDLSTIDTGAVYKKSYSIINGKPYEPDNDEYLKFYGNGTCLAIYGNIPFKSSDLDKDKSSTDWRHFVLTGNEIQIEGFYPNQAPIRQYDRKVLKGSIRKDTLFLDWGSGNQKKVFIKQAFQ